VHRPHNARTVRIAWLLAPALSVDVARGAGAGWSSGEARLASSEHGISAHEESGAAGGQAEPDAQTEAEPAETRALEP